MHAIRQRFAQPPARLPGRLEIGAVFPLACRHVVRLVLLAGMLAALLIAAAAQAQETGLVGSWNWGAGGGTTELFADGSGHDARGNSVRWTLQDAATRSYVLRWSHGYTDQVTLAADGKTLAGRNQNGYQFSASRLDTGRKALMPAIDAALAGDWSWGISSSLVVTIRPDGTGRDTRGNTLKWRLLDAATRTYELRWSHGYTDTVTLAADANSLQAVNDRGTRFSATRKGGGQGGGPGEAAVDLNGSWTRGRLHIWQDGANVLATATWKRDDGKYVIWRGEGRLQGRVVDLRIQYSPMPHGPVGEWRGVLTMSADGDALDAVYSYAGVQRDHQVYYRDR